MWPTYELRLSDPRRCSARRQRDGKPCGRYAIRGGTVCPIHGGKAPQVLRKAKARRDSDENLATMRAIVRRVYQRDYTARPDVPPVPAAENYVMPDPPPVIPPWLPPPEPPVVPPDSTPSARTPTPHPDLPDPQTATPTEPPSAPRLQTLEDAVVDANRTTRAGSVKRVR